jgi:hypothetical protein
MQKTVCKDWTAKTMSHFKCVYRRLKQSNHQGSGANEGQSINEVLDKNSPLFIFKVELTIKTKKGRFSKPNQPLFVLRNGIDTAFASS